MYAISAPIFVVFAVLTPLHYAVAEFASGTPEIVVETGATSSLYDSLFIAQAVRTKFADAPVMEHVARCESEFRQFSDSGDPLRGGYGGNMVGVFQIYDAVHRIDAEALGFDIDTLDGNLSYARHLYDYQGTNPWLSSYSCWGDSASSVENTEDINAENQTLISDLALGMIHPEVRTVQKILNQSGFILVADGPGSPGNETDKFGALTLAAIKKFQCRENIACDGDVYSTGYGRVGPATRAALLREASRDYEISVSGALPSVVELEDSIARLTKIVFELQTKIALANGL